MSSEPEEQKILVVEDDAPLASMVSDYLSMNGFQVTVESNGEQAIQRILEDNPDGVLLDINLRGVDGFTVCKAVRSQYNGPIIMITARGDEIDEVVGLELGADDYLAKPIRPRALLARLRLHMRRAVSEAETEATGPIEVGALIVDPGRRSVVLNGKNLELTTSEFDLLRLLAENVGQPLSRNEIFQKLHEINYDGQDRSIDLRISRLRRKLGDDPVRPERIKSVRGFGYMLSVDS